MLDAHVQLPQQVILATIIRAFNEPLFHRLSNGYTPEVELAPSFAGYYGLLSYYRFSYGNKKFQLHAITSLSHDIKEYLNQKQAFLMSIGAYLMARQAAGLSDSNRPKLSLIPYREIKYRVDSRSLTKHRRVGPRSPNL